MAVTRCNMRSNQKMLIQIPINRAINYLFYSQNTDWLHIDQKLRDSQNFPSLCCMFECLVYSCLSRQVICSNKELCQSSYVFQIIVLLNISGIRGHISQRTCEISMCYCPSTLPLSLPSVPLLIYKDSILQHFICIVFLLYWVIVRIQRTEKI